MTQMGYHPAMRFALMVLLYLCASQAWAGSTLQLTSERPIVVVVNARPFALNGRFPVNVTIKDAKSGLQSVSVRTLTGQVLWSGDILVNEAQVVTLTWNGKEMNVTGRRAIQRRVRMNTIQMPGTEPGGLTSQDTTLPEDRLLELVGQNEDGSDSEAPDPTEDMPLEGPPETEDATTALPAPLPPRERTPDGVIELIPRGEPGAAVLDLEARNSSWGNIYLDDELIWEHRNVGLSRRVYLPAGPHRLVIKDFRDRDLWLAGTVVTSTEEPVTLLFGANQPTDFKGAEGCWNPDK